MDAAAHRRLGRLQRRDGFYSVDRMVSGEGGRGYFRHHVVQVDVPATEDRPTAEARMEIPVAAEPAEPAADGDYRCVRIAFLTAEPAYKQTEYECF